MKLKGILIPGFLIFILLAAIHACGKTGKPTGTEETKGTWLGAFTHVSTGMDSVWSAAGGEQVFDALEMKARTVKERNPRIRGVTIKVLWRHINPSPDEFYFEGLDRLLATLEADRMQAILSLFPGGMSAPDWIYGEGAKKFISNTQYEGAYLYGPVPWDEKYMIFWKNCLEKLAGKINDDPRVFAVAILGHNFIGQEMLMSYANSAEDLERWDALGRSDRVVYDNWVHWIDLYARLFSKKKLVLTLGPFYGEWGKVDLTDQLAQYAVDKYGNRIILQILALHGRFDGLGNCLTYADPDMCAASMIRNRDRVFSGFETLGSFIEEPGRQGNVEMTVYNALKTNPLFIQLWYRDAISPDGPEIAQKIDDLYRKYRDWMPEDIKNDLIREGRYLDK